MVLNATIQSVVRSFVLANISTKTVDALGMRIKPGKSVDLFRAIEGLSEQKVYDAMAAPSGDLYKKIYIYRVLTLRSTNLVILASSADVATEALNSSVSTSTQLTEQSDVNTSYITLAIQNAVRVVEKSIGAAIEGDAVMTLGFGTSSEDISAALLNAAAASTFRKLLGIKLVSASGSLHGWANFEPVITPAESATDVDIGAPTVVKSNTVAGIPSFDAGYMLVEVVFDTDAGATKTYQVGDSFTVTIDVSGISLLSGVSNFVKTYNVIA